MIETTNCECQLDVIQKRITFIYMYQTVMKSNINCYRCSVASIWFEVWGAVDPITDIFDIMRKQLRFKKNFRFSRQNIPIRAYPFQSSTQKIIVSTKKFQFL